MTTTATRVFHDWEFLEDGTTIMPISCAFVREDGTEMYAVNADLDPIAVQRHPFLGSEVWPHLPRLKPRGRGGPYETLDLDHPDVRPLSQIARMISDFLADTPNLELWAWYAAYDHVTLAQLYGPMSDLPDHIPMFTQDLKQRALALGDPPVPEQLHGKHHALFDARHDRAIARFLDDYEARTSAPSFTSVTVMPASRWHINGDHPDDGPREHEGRVVRYHPYATTSRCGHAAPGPCLHCRAPLERHGWIYTADGGHTVCPGDWILTLPDGTHLPIPDAAYRALNAF